MVTDARSGRGVMLGRGALMGSGYALAVMAVGVWFNTGPVIENRFTVPPGFFAKGVLFTLLLGALIGAACAALLALRRGRWWHLLAVTGVWSALEIYAAPDSATFRRFALIGPAAGFLCVLLGRWIGRRWRWAPAALGLSLLLAGFATLSLYVRFVTPPPRPLPPPVAAPPGAPDVVLVVLDTVRADHVSAYGYGRPTTPVFDALAREAALFLDATAPATWSLPSHASLFTGLFVSAHGAHEEHRFLAPGPPTLAETLAAAGYDTRCFTANAWITDALGLTRGFASSDEAWRAGDMARTFQFIFRLLDRLGFGVVDKGGAEVVSHFEDWLAARPRGGPPAFAFLNFIEAHFPYHQLPAEYLTRFTSLPRGELRRLSLQLFAAQFGGESADAASIAAPAAAMYDAGIAYVDSLLGRVVAALRRRGSLDRTVLIVLADHGELLGEHGEFGHGRSLYEPVIHVPLLVRFPARIATGIRVPAPVSTVGVFATVLDLVGIAPAARINVGSLLPAVAGQVAGGPVLAEQYRTPLPGSMPARARDPLLQGEERFRSYRAGMHKIVLTSKDQGAYFFDLASDPAEAHPLGPRAVPEMARLQDELEAWRAALALPALDAPVDGAAAPPVDDAARERLRALGYAE